MEGLYSGLGSGTTLSALQLDAKIKLLVEAPAAVEDALASLLDHADAILQVLLWGACTSQLVAIINLWVGFLTVSM